MPPPKPKPSTGPASRKPAALYLWRCKLWFEATLGLTLLENWEETIFLSAFAVLLIFFVAGLYMYLPHLMLMEHRTLYYLWGDSDGTGPLLWRWFGFGIKDSNKARLAEEL